MDFFQFNDQKNELGKKKNMLLKQSKIFVGKADNVPIINMF